MCAEIKIHRPNVRETDAKGFQKEHNCNTLEEILYSDRGTEQINLNLLTHVFHALLVILGSERIRKSISVICCSARPLTLVYFFFFFYRIIVLKVSKSSSIDQKLDANGILEGSFLEFPSRWSQVNRDKFTAHPFQTKCISDILSCSLENNDQRNLGSFPRNRYLVFK